MSIRKTDKIRKCIRIFSGIPEIQMPLRSTLQPILVTVIRWKKSQPSRRGTMMAAVAEADTCRAMRGSGRCGISKTKRSLRRGNDRSQQCNNPMKNGENQKVITKLEEKKKEKNLCMSFYSQQNHTFNTRPQGKHRDGFKHNRYLTTRNVLSYISQVKTIKILSYEIIKECAVRTKREWVRLFRFGYHTILKKK